MFTVNERPTVSVRPAVMLSSSPLFWIVLAVLTLFTGFVPSRKRYLVSINVPIGVADTIKGKVVTTVAPNGILILAGIAPYGWYVVPNTPKEQIAIS